MQVFTSISAPSIVQQLLLKVASELLLKKAQRRIQQYFYFCITFISATECLQTNEMSWQSVFLLKAKRDCQRNGSSSEEMKMPLSVNLSCTLCWVCKLPGTWEADAQIPALPHLSNLKWETQV